MKFKRGDIVKKATPHKSLSYMRGVVVEVRENYESELTNHPPPLFRVVWAGKTVRQWYYEEDIVTVGKSGG
tara:strand:- start:261 stop:473 length:213 start_codon:yes stop_codon:yes gene_type:complete